MAHQGPLTKWRADQVATLLDYNLDLIHGRTPEYLVVDQFDTKGDDDTRTWVEAYLAFNPADPGDDPVYEDAGRALMGAIVHNDTPKTVVDAVVLANHFTRAQYASHILNTVTRPDDIDELTRVYTRSSREVLQMMTDLAFDSDANGLALSAITDGETATTEKWWIDLFAHSIPTVISEDTLPICVIDPTVGFLINGRSIVRNHMSAFRRPMLAMITDSLWMLVTTHEH